MNAPDSSHSCRAGAAWGPAQRAECMKLSLQCTWDEPAPPTPPHTCSIWSLGSGQQVLRLSGQPEAAHTQGSTSPMPAKCRALRVSLGAGHPPRAQPVTHRRSQTQKQSSPHLANTLFKGSQLFRTCSRQGKSERERAKRVGRFWPLRRPGSQDTGDSSKWAAREPPTRAHRPLCRPRPSK